MIMNVVKYSSVFITVLLGFHFLKSERERILLLLKEKDDKLQLSQERIIDLEKKLLAEKNSRNYILCKYLPEGPDCEPSPEPSPYNSCDEGKELDTELDTDNTNYDDISNLQNDTSEDSIEELVHPGEKNKNNNDDNDNNDDDNGERGVIEYTD